MSADIYLRVMTDDLRQFDVAVAQRIGRKTWSWSVTERVGLSVTSGGRRSTISYRCRDAALAGAMAALIAFAESSERP